MCRGSRSFVAGSSDVRAFDMPLNMFFSAAEVSGDILAGALARELKTFAPHTSMFGFGGSKLSEAGVPLLGDLTATSAIGVLDPVVRLPRYVRTRSATKRLLATTKPDADSIASVVHSPAGTSRR
jgi:lipid A disaccharide synthetase